MRLLIIHNRYQVRGGEDVAVDRELNLLQTAGHEVELFSVSNDSIQGFRERLNTAWNASYSNVSKIAIQKKIQEFRPEIVHVHNFFPLISPSVYDSCKDQGVPVVQTLHNYRIACANGLFLRDGKPCEDCLTKGFAQSIKNRCYRDSLSATLPVYHMISTGWRRNIWNEKVTKFWAITGFARDKFIQAGIDPEKISVKPNFSPDISLGQPGITRGNSGLYVGRLSQEKGIFNLLTAHQRRSFPLRIVTSERPSQDQLRDGVQYVVGGGANEVAREMLTCAFLVMPTECYEGGVPLVLLEGMAASTPMIVSRIGEMARIFTHEENALLIEPGNPEMLSQAVARIQADSNLRAKIGLGARRIFEEKFSEKTNLKMMETLYREVLAAKYQNSGV